MKYIYEQCNFINEWDNIDCVYNLNKLNSRFVTPKPYHKYITKYNNIIIMDWLDGLTLNELSNVQKPIAFDLIMGYGLKSIFYDGCIHGDFHQGNCKFQLNDTGHKLAVFDFGVICKLTREEQNIMHK